MCNLCVLPQGKILRTGRNLNLGWNILKWAISMHRKVYVFQQCWNETMRRSITVKFIHSKSSALSNYYIFIAYLDIVVMLLSVP